VTSILDVFEEESDVVDTSNSGNKLD